MPHGSGEPSNNFKAFTTVQQNATATILGMYSAVANLTFTQITESSTQTATLRYAESDTPSTAWGYYPSTSPEGGDAWFNNSTHWYDNPAVGNYAWLTIIHETGHLLGLKHPQDTMGSFGAVPASQVLIRILGDELPVLYRGFHHRRPHECDVELPDHVDGIRHRRPAVHVWCEL